MDNKLTKTILSQVQRLNPDTRQKRDVIVRSCGMANCKSWLANLMGIARK